MDYFEDGALNDHGHAWVDGGFLLFLGLVVVRVLFLFLALDHFHLGDVGVDATLDLAPAEILGNDEPAVVSVLLDGLGFVLLDDADMERVVGTSEEGVLDDLGGVFDDVYFLVLRLLLEDVLVDGVHLLEQALEEVIVNCVYLLYHRLLLLLLGDFLLLVGNEAVYEHSSNSSEDYTDHEDYYKGQDLKGSPVPILSAGYESRGFD